MSLVARPLARRIDRLSRHAHAFHRFAHHPLCGRYDGELVALGGRTRLCRGCLLALGGTAAGLALGVAVPALGLPALGLAVVAAAVGVAWPARRRKVWTRLLPAAALATAFAAGWREPLGFGAVLSGISLASGLAALWAYRSRGPNRDPCQTCPERSLTVPCSGVQPILRREAAFRRLTSRWLDEGRVRLDGIRPSTSLGALVAAQPSASPPPASLPDPRASGAGAAAP